MTTLKYYDGTQYQPLPGMPGPTGPAGPAGPTGAQGPPAPGVTLNYVAQGWGPSVANTGTVPFQITATGLKANHSYLVTGYAVGINNTASVATARYGVTVSGGAQNTGPNQGAWICYQANIAANQTPASGGYPTSTTASFIYTPPSDGDYVFQIFSVGTASAITFAINNCAIYVADMTGTQGPIGATGPTGPTGPAPVGSTIVSVRGYRNAAFTMGTASQGPAGLIYDGEQWDTHNDYNPTTGIFTCSVAGKYKVVAQACSVQSTASGQTVFLRTYKNSTIVTQNFGQYSSATGQNIYSQNVDTLDLAVGDTVSFDCYGPSALGLVVYNSGGTANALAQTYMSIDLLSGNGPPGPTGATGPTGPAYAAGQMYSLVYYQTIPRPSTASPVTVTHNLGTTFPLVQLYDSVTLEMVIAQVQVIDANHVAISVAQNMPNPLNIVVMGVAASPVPINPGDYATKSYVDGSTDKGLLAGTIDLNTVVGPGNYQSAGGNPNGPPIPPGAFMLEVQSVSGGALQQRVTLISYPSYIATRENSGGSWGAWHSPAAGIILAATGPPSTFTTLGNVFTTGAPVVPVVASRRYKVSLWWYFTNNSGAALGFAYFTITDTLNFTSSIPNNRIGWLGATIGAGQSWFGSGSHTYLPNSGGSPTFTVGVNASGSPISIAAGGCELVLEDMGI